MTFTQRFLFAAIFGFGAVAASAQTLDGTWVFDRVVDYEGLDNKPAPPLASTIQIVGEQLSLLPNCLIRLRKESYYPGGPFQSLLKSGEDETTVGKFLFKEFSFKLLGTKTFYRADSHMDHCNKLASDFLVSDDRLLAIRAGSYFYSFKRAKVASAENPTVSAAGSGGVARPVVNLYGLKPSQLPFNVASYMGLCAASIPKVKGIPQSTLRCSPVYYPYVASSQSKDPLSRLVGSHTYQKGGARNDSEDYNNPVANNLHPVFLVFPPLEAVVLVRVEDIERAEERDVIKGAYLSIKDDKVVDQLNESCSFNQNYLCSAEGKKTKYQLLPTGKFVALE